MMTPLAERCYREGRSARLRGLIKAAVNPRVLTGAAIPALERKSLEALGEQVSRTVASPQTSYLKTLTQLLLPGFNRLPYGKQLSQDHVQTVRSMGQQLKGLKGAPTAAKQLREAIRGKAQNFRQLQRQNFAEIGAAAKPKLDFANKAIPAATGAAVGGAAMGAAGGALGHQEGRYGMADQMANAPLLTRLRYLLAPTAATADLYHPAKKTRV
jgi:hypothetical protein